MPDIDSLGWLGPYVTIDWEAAARDLAHYYLSVNFDGQEYLIRA